MSCPMQLCQMTHLISLALAGTDVMLLLLMPNANEGPDMLHIGGRKGGSP